MGCTSSKTRDDIATGSSTPPATLLPAANLPGTTVESSGCHGGCVAYLAGFAADAEQHQPHSQLVKEKVPMSSGGRTGMPRLSNDSFQAGCTPAMSGDFAGAGVVLAAEGPVTRGSSRRGSMGSDHHNTEVSGTSQLRMALDVEDFVVSVVLQQVELGPAIGPWGRARVFRGSWQDKQVAVKVTDHVVYGSQGQDTECLDWLLKESARSRVLRHPQLVQIHHCGLKRVTGSLTADDACAIVGMHDGDSACSDVDIFFQDEESEDESDPAGRRQHVQLWIIAEYCNRGTLADAIVRGWLRRRRTLEAPPNLRHILLTAQEIASALCYLHSKGFVHGCLDARAVLLCCTRGAPRRFTAKVSTACRLNMWTTSQQQQRLLSYSHLVHTAPELFTAGSPTTAADVYSFGVLCHEMFSGQLAWADRKQLQLVRMLVMQHTRLPPLDNCPESFQALVSACVNPDPAARPSFASILDTLAGMLAGSGGSSTSGGGRAGAELTRERIELDDA